jgi:hypothetical protein
MVARLRSRLSISAMCWALVLPGLVQGGDDVAVSLETLARGIDTIAFHSSEAVFGRGHAPNRVEEYDIAVGSGGRYCFDSLTISADGSRRITSWHEDGVRAYASRTFPAFADVVEAVEIQPVRSSPTKYNGTMCRALWLVLPAGKTPAQHLKSGATLGQEHDKSGNPVTVLQFHRNQVPVRCELDAGHDWLPRRVNVGKGLEIEVTRFQRANGQWFPAEGRSQEALHSSEGIRTTTSEFRISRLRINESLTNSIFGLPKIEDGVAVIDTITGERRNQGSADALKLRREKYRTPPDENSAVTDSNAAPLRVPRDPPRDPWAFGILGVSVGVILVVSARRLKSFGRGG